MLSGDNSILQKATDAKTQTGIGQEKEIVALAYNSALAKKVGNGDSTAVTSEDLNTELTNQDAFANGENPINVTFTGSKNSYTIDANGKISIFFPPQKVTDVKTHIGEKGIALSESETILLEDDLGNEIKVPKGFCIAEDSGTKVEEGIVIEDAMYVNTKGSQFVWIPVGNQIKVSERIDSTGIISVTLGRYMFNNPSDGMEVPLQIASNYQENIAIGDYYYEYESNPDGKNYDNSKAKNLKAFVSSALENGGFYISRYEACIDTNKNQSDYANFSWKNGNYVPRRRK